MGLSACGGGGGGSGTATNPFGGKPNGPHDTDGVRPIEHSAILSNEVSNSQGLPILPSFEEFNAWADAQSTQGQLVDTTFVMSQNGEFNSSVSLRTQNSEMTSALSALVFETKAIVGRNIVMDRELNKEVYGKIPTSCQTVSCVGEAVFGRTYGARLYYKLNFGVLVSEYVQEDRLSPFTSDENVETVLYAIATFPNNMMPLARSSFFPNFEHMSENFLIAPFKKGYVLPGSPNNAAAINNTMVSWYQGEEPRYADTSIYLYDRWQNSGDYFQKVATVFHELMHTFDRAHHSKTEAWKSFSSWSGSDEQGWVMNNKSKTCSRYGESAPQEDFAECGLMYRFAPLHLQAISMEKYLYFKNNVFNGIEFVEARTIEPFVPRFF